MFTIILIILAIHLVKRMENKSTQKYYNMMYHSKNHAEDNNNHHNGLSLSEHLVELEDIRNVKVEFSNGIESQYALGSRKVRLGVDVIYSRFSLALLIALHETMHAVQHKREGWKMALVTLITKAQRHSLLAIVMTALLSVFWFDENSTFVFAVLFVLSLKAFEHLVVLFIETDAWLKVRKHSMTKEIIKTKEQTLRARKFALVCLQSYVWQFLRSALVVAMIASIFKFVNQFI